MPPLEAWLVVDTSTKYKEPVMTKLIDLGRVSEETKGTQFNSVNFDSLGAKRTESGITYASTTLNPDFVKVEEPE